MDVASVDIRHVALDDKNRYKEDMKSQLQAALTWETNIDQGPLAFKQDIVQTMFDNGHAVIVPVQTSVDPTTNVAFDILSLRVGRVTEFFPHHVKVRVYNEDTMMHEELILPKAIVAIVPNPLYSVMNETNSTLQRLIRKLSILDAVDEQSGSGKLDLIIQLPYVIKSEARKNQAEERRRAIEDQLKNSKYGIAYTDGTEKVTQLNRPAENNLLNQVEFLTNMLYNQLGITDSVMNGTADEAAMINYYNRTVEPILQAIVESMNRAFLGPASVRKKERIRYFRDPFRLVPVSEIAKIADVFSRNEIMSANEFREIVGLMPVDDPKADELTNSNMPTNQPAPAISQVQGTVERSEADSSQPSTDSE
jgi:hypothetical protein